MADYAQARWKESKEATIIRIIRHDGGMNPLMALTDVVPDEQLNTRLQYYVSTRLLPEPFQDLLGMEATLKKIAVMLYPKQEI